MRSWARNIALFGLSLGLLAACDEGAFETAPATTASSSGAGGSGATATSTSDAATSGTTGSSTATASASGTGGSGGMSGSGGSGGTSGSGGAGGGGCTPVAQDASATGKACTVSGDCPDGYTCWTFNGLVSQTLCAILCETTCECPAGTTCKLQSDKGGSWYQCLE